MEAILSFSIEPDLTGVNSPVPVRDNGDGSYSFLYRPVEEGQVTLSVKVEGKEVCGSPLKWNVTSKLPGLLTSPQGKSDKRKPVRKVKKFSGFREGMHCWKLKVTSFSDKDNCVLEIGITYNGRYYGQKQTRWSWQYHSRVEPKLSRSDGQIPSITSVENNDVFIVFLNLQSKKLTIYNVRSKQTEIFAGIEGDDFSPIIRCDVLELIDLYGLYPELALQ